MMMRNGFNKEAICWLEEISIMQKNASSTLIESILFKELRHIRYRLRRRINYSGLRQTKKIF